MTGSGVLVTGFASKGEDLVTNYITSKSSWLLMYGEPTNEAERYFYTACMEVINQGGKLYCCKLPYTNEAGSSYLYKKYTVTSQAENIADEFGLTANNEMMIDDTLSTFNRINSDTTVGLMTRDLLDETLGGESKPDAQSIYIIDKTRDTLKLLGDKECIGIIPVITTPLNAMAVQNMLNIPELTSGEAAIDLAELQCVSSAETLSSVAIEEGDASIAFNSTSGDSISKQAASYFPAINLDGDGKYEPDYLRRIGIVIYKAYLDSSAGNKISYTPVESFIGGFDPKGTDPSSGTSTFIDRIVNTQSEYIYVCTNVTEIEKNKPQMYFASELKSGILSFPTDMMVKEIGVSDILTNLDIVFDKNKDILEKQIDLVVDAGVSNIAQFLNDVYSDDKTGEYNPELLPWSFKGKESTDIWKTVIFKYDNFCKNIRKDCMFLCDGPRTMVLQGNLKIVRPTKPTNTIDSKLLPNVKYLTGINTSYGAGYVDWFQLADDFTGDLFWVPPSIKAASVCINCDLNYNYWDAPAGLNRGMVQALDIAFNPSIAQAGQIYTKSWNYAINWPNDGITIEGQKTL